MSHNEPCTLSHFSVVKEVLRSGQDGINRSKISATNLQMPQLPRACQDQYDDLRNAVPNSPRIRSLTQVPKVCLPFALVLLLSSDIFEFRVQFTNFSCNFRNMRSIMVDIWTRVSDDDIEIEPDVRRG
jgi:hypothetical protein